MSDRREVLAEHDRRPLADWEERFAARGGDALPKGLGVTRHLNLAAASKIIPGATSISLRNNADSAGLLVSGEALDTFLEVEEA